MNESRGSGGSRQVRAGFGRPGLTHGQRGGGDARGRDENASRDALQVAGAVEGLHHHVIRARRGQRAIGELSIPGDGGGERARRPLPRRGSPSASIPAGRGFRFPRRSSRSPHRARSILLFACCPELVQRLLLPLCSSMSASLRISNLNFITSRPISVSSNIQPSVTILKIPKAFPLSRSGVILLVPKSSRIVPSSS